MSSLSRIASILALSAAGLALAACGGGGTTSAESTAGTTTAPPAKTTTSSGATTTTGGKRPVVSPAERTPLDPNKTYTVEFQTNEGTFTVTLDQKASPHTTASFAALVRKKYFDGTVFHRIIPGFLIQGGDPTGTGQGFPGYTVVDKPPAGTRYTPNVVAMAKTTVQAAGTAGSQFFIITKGEPLKGGPPLYAVLGRVTGGKDVVQKIGKLGDVATELPTKRVVIKHALLHES
jgi:cyclophilin family peptidyl-prolyl cis-trans isomerase